MDIETPPPYEIEPRAKQVAARLRAFGLGEFIGALEGHGYSRPESFPTTPAGSGYYLEAERMLDAFRKTAATLGMSPGQCEVFSTHVAQFFADQNRAHACAAWDPLMAHVLAEAKYLHCWQMFQIAGLTFEAVCRGSDADVRRSMSYFSTAAVHDLMACTVRAHALRVREGEENKV